MSVSKEFAQAVEAGNLLRVRIMLKDSLLLDPTLVMFGEREAYAKERLADLYDAHDGEELKLDEGDWNKDYLNQQMVNVVTNFSRERVELLKRMTRVIFRETADQVERERAEKKNNSHETIQKQVGAGTAVVGAAIAVAGICTSYTALTVGGVVVAAAGAAMLISSKRK